MDAATADRHYLQATEHLLRGRPAEAVTLLERVPEAARGPEFSLALGKAHLERGRGAEAAHVLRPLAEGSAYALLLLAAALAADGQPEKASAALARVAERDPRLERSARALGRRIAAGGPTQVRF